MVGFSLKNKLFVVIDRKGFVLPLVYVDNLVDAIILAMTADNSVGQTYNVVDDERIDKKAYMDGFIRKLYTGAVCLYFPYKLFAGIVAVQEKVFGLLKREPVISMYRLQSSQNAVVYDATKIRDELGWRPAVGFSDAVGKIVLDSHSDVNKI
jgi:nucleoside-diphosphate-sugar epimerase